MLPGVTVLRPEPVRDARGFFSRTYDAAVAARVGVRRADYVQDSQSRSAHAVLRGLHGRRDGGEAKIVRVARGAVHLVVVDGRSESPTFGRHLALRLDDDHLLSVVVPRRMLLGYQALSRYTDICYSIDRVHDQSQAVGVRFDDPDLGVDWPLEPSVLSERDRRAGSWADYVASGAGERVDASRAEEEPVAPSSSAHPSRIAS